MYKISEFLVGLNKVIVLLICLKIPREVDVFCSEPVLTAFMGMSSVTPSIVLVAFLVSAVHCPEQMGAGYWETK